MIRILFVCLGNICRSPMAEAVFRHKVLSHGLEDIIEVDSAGTGNWHVGHPPHKGTQDILRKNGINFDGLTARLFTKDDGSKFDYIIAMDESNKKNILKVINGGTKVFRLLDFVTDQPIRDVPDPYYTGNFDQVYDLIDKATEALFNYICKENNLSWEVK